MTEDGQTQRQAQAERVLRSLDAGVPAYVQPRKSRFGLRRKPSELTIFHVVSCGAFPDLPDETNAEDALERGLTLCTMCVIKIMRDL